LVASRVTVKSRYCQVAVLSPVCCAAWRRHAFALPFGLSILTSSPHLGVLTKCAHGCVVSVDCVSDLSWATFHFNLVSIKTHTNFNTCMRSRTQTHMPQQDIVRFDPRIELRHVARVARRRSASPMHQRLGEDQRHTVWRTRHGKDSVQDHPVQTCSY